jgi:hypothetical protein
MENFAITLVCIALLIVGALSISMSALNAVNAVSDALRVEEGLARDMANTSILCENSSSTSGGATVTMYVRNEGKTALSNYRAWDVIVRYQNGSTLWIPFSAATPGWQTSGFFFPGPIGNLPA